MRTLLLMVPLCLIAAAVLAGEPSWPTAGWPSASPDAEGLDAAVLSRFDAELARGEQGYVDGMLVIRHGRIVYEKRYAPDYDGLFATAPDRTPGLYNYYDPRWHPWYERGALHTLQSVSKSVTSALVGIAIARGEIPGVEAKALPYFADYKVDADPRRGRWTIEKLLTMTSGIRWDEDTVPYTDPANSCAGMEASRDWVQFVLDQPMAAEPGEVFVYNSGVTELLAAVLKKATGQHADDYAAEHLFRPLGIADFHWKRTPTGHPDTEGGLYLTPRDLAKIGYLFSHDGMWEGRRLLPAGWAAESTRPRVALAPGAALRYGYQWWSLPAEGRPEHFAAIGYGGQYLLVVPSLELIAVFTGWNIYDRPELDPGVALQRVLEAVRR
jgi:CubicO group peptidase (beta-lactamase class C family)